MAAANSTTWECPGCFAKKNLQQTHLGDHEGIIKKSEASPTKRMSRPLRIMQWNANGLNPKLREFVGKEKIDVVLVQET